MYWIHEEGDPDIGFTWDIFQSQGDRVVRIASFYGEPMAEKFMAAIQWMETFESGSMSIPKPAAKAKTPKVNVIFTPEKKKTTPRKV